MLNDNYPAGVTDATIDEYYGDSADPIEVEVCVSTTLSRVCTIETSDYIEERWEDSEADEDGYVVTTGGIDYDFRYCDFKKDYQDQEYSVVELLNLLKDVAEDMLKGTYGPLNPIDKNKWTVVRNSCDWVEDELEVCENQNFQH